LISNFCPAPLLSTKVPVTEIAAPVVILLMFHQEFFKIDYIVWLIDPTIDKLIVSKSSHPSLCIYFMKRSGAV
jgi:hypothetical protein